MIVELLRDERQARDGRVAQPDRRAAVWQFVRELEYEIFALPEERRQPVRPIGSADDLVHSAGNNFILVHDGRLLGAIGREYALGAS
jgi:hypothetical protein